MTGRRITTPRLVLEPIRLEVARAIVGGDLSVVEAGEGWPHADTLDGLRMEAEHAESDEQTGWFITLATAEGEPGTVIGDCGWRGGPDHNGDAEIGYGLAVPYRGRGLGGEAVAGLVGWARHQPGLRRLTAEVRTDNVPSRRVLERLGFAIDRIEEPHVYYTLPADPAR